MRTAQIRLHDIVAMFRRRWKLPAYSVAIVTVISLIGAFTLTRRYESSTTIMVRPDKTLAPMTGYDMMMAFEEQLRNYAEIIYSRSVLSALADSLGYVVEGKPENVVQGILHEVGNNISTNRLGTDSFRITYLDTDPKRAQKGAEQVADLFIQTKIGVENRQNALTVQFYEQKVAELRNEYESRVRTMVTSMKQRVQEMPKESRSLYNSMDEVEKSIATTDLQIRNLQSKLNQLRTLPDNLENNPDDFRREDGKQGLFELSRAEVPYAAELRTLVTQYDQTTRAYRGKYPEVEKLENQIVELLKRMRLATEAEISRLQSDLSLNERRRASVIDGLKESFAQQKFSADKESSFDVERKQYEDMKARLEQARLAQEVGSRGANQFIVLDPAIVPTVPTKPNRTMILAAGIGIGFAIGIIASILAEILDTTVRSPRDIEVYQKPIIALLPDGDYGAD